jgi:16S rRNA (adenine1518-N6/adenine1519-N6)-dimethyltransferase
LAKEEKTKQCTETSRYSRSLKSHAFMDKRAEELSVEDFINFTQEWKTAKN